MKSGANTQGFTIVETLIYLAVSAAIMVSVLTLVGGSQNKAQFQQAVNDIDQQINDIINNVSNGYYNNTGNIKCVDNGTAAPYLQELSAELGTNKDCIFLGRVIQFGESGDGNKLNIYNAVGFREKDGKQVTSLSESNIRLIAKGTGATAAFPDASEKRTLKNGFTVSNMYYDGDTTKQISGIAILSDFAQTRNSSSVLKSGSQSIGIYAINSTSKSDSMMSFVDKANVITNYDLNTVNGDGIFICINSSTSNQRVEIKLGGTAQSLNTVLETKDGDC